MESSSRNPLTGVKEEPCGSQPRDLEEDYFRMLLYLPLLPAPVPFLFLLLYSPMFVYSFAN